MYRRSFIKLSAAAGAAAALPLGFSHITYAAPLKGGKKPYTIDPKTRKMTTAAQRKSAGKKLQATRQAAGLAAVATPTMGPGGVPDLFSTIPNWANSPMPSGALASQAVITYGGSGYTAAPNVTISDFYGTGGGAVATATVDLATGSPTFGQVTSIAISPGTTYYTAPILTIDPPTTVGGETATAIATLTGALVGFTNLFGGTGYTTPPVVVLSGGGGSGAAASATIDPVLGMVTAVTVASGGAGYTSAPTVTFAGGNGSGASVTAVISTGGPISGGIRKFVDALPQLTPAGVNGLGQYLPVAVPDTTSFVDAASPTGHDDYYWIGLIQYSRKLHTDLAPTMLRGYVQLTTTPNSNQLFYPGTTNPILDPVTSQPLYSVDPPQYLGPVIVANRDVPVRVKFTNLLPTGAGGNLFVPVDPTYMGAGMGPTGSITSIKVTTAGGGYTSAPAVTVAAPPAGGVRATATAYLNSLGGVASIDITNVGAGYAPAPALPPAITIAAPPTGGTQAVAAATVGDGSNVTQNRSAMHLHGGVTPWISDGTPHQWITPAGETTVYPKGVSVHNVPDMPDPGDGSQTLFYTNQQSARLMFYHDHAYGITRLHVYSGVAAGYVIQDPVEQALVNGALIPGTTTTPAAGTIPAAEIPLVIQDKTFVDANTIKFQDPTWNWGTTPGTPVTGDLWFPHIYLPNQNPAPMMEGANATGRWDYGPWFWPPFTGIQYGSVPNPYCKPAPPAAGTFEADNPPYDNSGAPWEPPFMPGIPTPSGVPEGFMDTPMVNGTVYPFVNLQPQAYRFRILNACNDRSLNLQLYVADPTVVAPTLVTNPLTEVRMVPAVPNAGLPARWPTDGRDGGVPDPASQGPAWIQIGTEGGLMPNPAVIPQTPVGYNYNRRDITVLNVSNKCLFLGPAERADVIVDFSKMGGKTLIMYNDAPAPVPAFDPRIDYYTGDPDQTDSGGTPTTIPGYGPNTRTIMQINVAAGTGTAFDLAGLQAALPVAFAASQPAPIVKQAAYNAAYLATYPTDPYVRIQDNYMRNGPVAAITVTSGGSGYTAPPNVLIGAPPAGGVQATAVATVVGGAVTAITVTNGGEGYKSPPTVTVDPSPGGVTATATAKFRYLQPKAIQELFTADYGRMNATFGVELPFTNMTTQTTIPYGYIDPVTEIVRAPDPGALPGTPTEGTQIWKITHNGVDTHAIHFHLFNVQLVNRVGWDGMVKPPEPNEVGWKETVRMNPLEDAIVALTPVVPTLPFKLPNSLRPMDVTMALGSTMGFSGIDTNNQPVTVTNQMVNFGHEYVWHCHLLGHEENDMMRPMAVAVTPEAPSKLVATLKGNGLALTWVDNSLNETGFTIQRAKDAGFTVGLVTWTVGAGVTTFTDTTYKPNQTPYYYRVFATNTVGSTVAGYPSMMVSSGYSNVVGPPTGTTTLLSVTQAAATKSPVVVTWSYATLGDQTGFTIQHATNSTFTTGVSTFAVAGNVLTFSDTKVKAGTTYFYRVMATNALGNGAWSTTVLSITPHA